MTLTMGAHLEPFAERRTVSTSEQGRIQHVKGDGGGIVANGVFSDKGDGEQGRGRRGMRQRARRARNRREDHCESLVDGVLRVHYGDPAPMRGDGLQRIYGWCASDIAE